MFRGEGKKRSREEAEIDSEFNRSVSVGILIAQIREQSFSEGLSNDDTLNWPD